MKNKLKLSAIVISLATPLSATATHTNTVPGPPPTPQVTISIDPIATMGNDHIAVKVSGSYTCGPLLGTHSNTSSGLGAVYQASGRKVTQADFFFNPVCDNQPQTFEVNAIAKNISTFEGGIITVTPFHGGPAFATARIFAQSCNSNYVSSCSSSNTSTEVSIRISGGGAH